eukprot:Blabericola_migrator_1__5031@NODE_260_length_10712_cov_94_884922_g218_i0_p4_GENE_NODE_260_length_10712_cov_94_884922_g218_i0NODE_260_length_10712_cov_94_884922_g218_i0_p4_ORF_typecomplete_len246_score59_91_NODE_260_length_10712_cov_94_884922_g218_i019382675
MPRLTRLEIMGLATFADLCVSAVSLDPAWLKRNMLASRGSAFKSDLRCLKAYINISSDVVTRLVTSHYHEDDTLTAALFLVYFLGASEGLVRVLVDPPLKQQIKAMAALLSSSGDELLECVNDPEVASCWLQILYHHTPTLSPGVLTLLEVQAIEDGQSPKTLLSAFVKRLGALQTLPDHTPAQPALFLTVNHPLFRECVALKLRMYYAIEAMNCSEEMALVRDYMKRVPPAPRPKSRCVQIMDF